MRSLRRIQWCLLRGKFDGVAKFRAFYWYVLRRWETEICASCGRPVRIVWWCHDDALWTAVTGHPKPPGRESASGISCIYCFDAAAKSAGAGWIEWAPLNLRYLHAQEQVGEDRG